MNNKKISILMGIYNCEKTLEEAVASIQAQTYENWELILCDDGSADCTLKLAKELAAEDSRIKVITNEKNLGLNLTLNHCLEYATGEYIARMDGDDISLPERFEKEVEFLENNPDYDIVSAPMVYFDESGDWGRGKSKEFPQAVDFIPGTPFCHAPCMIRTEAIRSIGGYSTDQRTLRAEDYNLWFRMYANGSKGGNLTEPLYKMRDDQNAYSRRKFRYCLNEAYVRFTGYKMLKLPVKAYLFAIRPILVGLLPKKAYMYLHKKRKS